MLSGATDGKVKRYSKDGVKEVYSKLAKPAGKKYKYNLEGGNMKKIYRIFILIVLLSALTGCDAGLEIMGMEIVNYPDRLIYVANKDNELDLSGGEIEFILKDKAAQSIDPMTEEEMEIRHDIDFSKPGVYIVTLYRHDDAKVQFPIQVVDEIYLKNLLEE